MGCHAQLCLCLRVEGSKREKEGAVIGTAQPVILQELMWRY